MKHIHTFDDFNSLNENTEPITYHAIFGTKSNGRMWINTKWRESPNVKEMFPKLEIFDYKEFKLPKEQKKFDTYWDTLTKKYDK